MKCLPVLSSQLLSHRPPFRSKRTTNIGIMARKTALLSYVPKVDQFWRHELQPDFHFLNWITRSNEYRFLSKGDHFNVRDTRSATKNPL
jgi:hypothetical protein